MLSYFLGGAAVATVGSYAYLKSLAMRSPWRFENIADQTGKVVVVTGANSGIGYHFSRHMVRKKAHVIMGCRSAEKGKEALESIKKEFPGASVEMRVVDVASKKSVRDFASGILKDYTRLDCLNNNAGVMMTETTLIDGVDNTFATNNFGPFLLTGLLLPLMEKTPGARIISISSGVHRRAQILPWSQLNDPKLNTFEWKQSRYRLSKAMNILFAQRLAKLLQENHSQVISVGCHPGYSDTGLQTKVDNVIGRFIYTHVTNKIMAQSAEMGSAVPLMAATDPTVKNGEYFGPCGFGEMVGWPTRNDVHGIAKDEKFSEEAWKMAEEWSGLKFTFQSTTEEEK